MIIVKTCNLINCNREMELNFPKLNAVGIRNGVMVVVTKHFTAAMSRSGINDPTLLRH